MGYFISHAEAVVYNEKKQKKIGFILFNFKFQLAKSVNNSCLLYAQFICFKYQLN